MESGIDISKDRYETETETNFVKDMQSYTFRIMVQLH